MDLRLGHEGDLALDRRDLTTVSGVEEMAQRRRIRLRLFLFLPLGKGLFSYVEEA